MCMHSYLSVPCTSARHFTRMLCFQVALFADRKIWKTNLLLCIGYICLLPLFCACFGKLQMHHLLPKTFREREYVTAARPRGHAQVLRPAHSCHSRTNVETLSSLLPVRMSWATSLPSLPHRYTALGGSIFHVVFYVTFDCRHMIYSAHLSRHFQVRQRSISAQLSFKGSLCY